MDVLRPFFFSPQKRRSLNRLIRLVRRRFNETRAQPQSYSQRMHPPRYRTTVTNLLAASRGLFSFLVAGLLPFARVDLTNGIIHSGDSGVGSPCPSLLKCLRRQAFLQALRSQSRARKCASGDYGAKVRTQMRLVAGLPRWIVRLPTASVIVSSYSRLRMRARAPGCIARPERNLRNSASFS